MRKAIFWTCFVVMVATFLLSAQYQAPCSAETDELIRKARALLDALSRNDFEAAVTDFDARMGKVFGPDKIAEFWKQVPDKMGVFKRQTAARQEKLGPYDIVLITCEFEKVTLDARIVFDKDKKIAGLQFVPSLPPAKYEPPSSADLATFEEKEVTVGHGEWELAGSLTFPKGEGPFPAVVLVHGSGPNDRDETLGPNKPFKDLAWGLATRGIAVLRYEKRTLVYGSRLVADPKLSATLTVKQETIDDALQGVRLLLAIHKIDRKKIFVLGHSLGGMLIPRIAIEGQNLDLAGFIVMAGLTRPLEETYVQQMTYLFGLDGQLSDDDKKQLDEIKRQVAKIKALQESDCSSSEKLMNAPPSYWLDLRGYYPPDVALKIEKPILILQGGRDYQVTAEDFENWKKALASRSDVEFRLYPKLNHLFFEGQGQPTPNEYLQVHGSVAAEVIADIAAFILKHS